MADTNSVEWLPSAPSSPPPAYASVISAIDRDERPTPNDRKAITYEGPSRYNQGYPDIERKSPKTNMKYEKQEEVRAYRQSYQDIVIPELTGDTVCMRGTNTQGPVNPFELAAPFTVHQSPVASKTIDDQDISELLGDLSFAHELPSCEPDPGPPPGYPPRPPKMSISQGPNVSSSKLRNRRNNWESLPELPAMTRRRPVTTHANTDSGLMPPSEKNPSCEMPLRRPMSAGQVNSHQLPPFPSFRQRPSARQSYVTPSGHHNEATFPHDSQQYLGASVNSRTVSRPLSDHQRDTHSACSEADRPLVEASRDPSLARMHRQKNMLNLLGSLGT